MHDEPSFFLLTHLEYISIDEHLFVELYLDNGI